MKKNVILVVALIALMGFSAFAQDAESDFQVTKTATAVTITKYVGSKKVVNIPPKIQNLPVTIIGQSAFAKNTAITSITIPNGVTSIGNSAFYGCNNLENITIPSSVKSIGQMAFYELIYLKSITIPAGVSSIDTLAFSGCPNLTSVTFQGNITPPSSFSDSAFSGDLQAKFYATDKTK